MTNNLYKVEGTAFKHGVCMGGTTLEILAPTEGDAIRSFKEILTKRICSMSFINPINVVIEANAFLA